MPNDLKRKQYQTREVKRLLLSPVFTCKILGDLISCPSLNKTVNQKDYKMVYKPFSYVNFETQNGILNLIGHGGHRL